MADPRIVREGLIKADEDLDFAKINLDEDHAFYSQICFHFQQAAEKYLKAFVVAYDLEEIHEFGVEVVVDLFFAI